MPSITIEPRVNVQSAPAYPIADQPGPVEGNSSSSFNTSIDACDADHLRSIMKSIGSNDQSVREAIARGLQTATSSDDVHVAVRTGAPKRKALHEADGNRSMPKKRRYKKKKVKTVRPGSRAECGHCGDKAKIDDADSPCRYHKGHLKPDLQWWKDTGAAEYGMTEFDESYCGWPGSDRRFANMLAHPEGYVWSCCKSDGTTEGCVKALHVTGRKHQYGKLYQVAKLRREGGWVSDWWSGVYRDPNRVVRTSIYTNIPGAAGDHDNRLESLWPVR